MEKGMRHKADGKGKGQRKRLRVVECRRPTAAHREARFSDGEGFPCFARDRANAEGPALLLLGRDGAPMRVGRALARELGELLLRFGKTGSLKARRARAKAPASVAGVREALAELVADVQAGRRRLGRIDLGWLFRMASADRAHLPGFDKDDAAWSRGFPVTLGR